MKRIAVLITCFNRKAKTLECLKNLYNQEGYMKTFDFEVYLVDDASTDGTSIAVKNQFPAVNILLGNGQLFWNRGMHRAWKEAEDGEYDFYLWLNDDTVLFQDALCELINSMPSNNEPTIVCGAVCSEDGNKFTYGGLTKAGKSVIPNGQIQVCYVINGNCVLINREAYAIVGNLDPIFPHAIGDHDYGLRLLKFGGNVITTRKYLGYCERNEKLPSWCYSDTPFAKRLKALYSPLGNSHPKYFFIYERRHFGFLIALKHYLSIHLRVLIPSLWK